MSEHYSGKLIWKLDSGEHPENPWSLDHDDNHDASWIGISTENGRTVALIVNDDSTRPLASHDAELDANARRLAACWNALSHLDTEALEELERNGDKLVATSKYVGQARRERDALLAALECEAALEMPAKEGAEVLERHGWLYADRFELSSTEFVKRLRDSAIAAAKAGAA